MCSAHLGTADIDRAGAIGVWSRLRVDWYAHAQRLVYIIVVNAVWYHTGRPAGPVRYLLIRDVAGQFDPQALLSTDPTLDPTLKRNSLDARWSA